MSPQIVPAFTEQQQEEPWWFYQDFSEEQKQKVDEFLNNFSIELKEFISLPQKECIRTLAEKMGTIVHPQFKEALHDEKTQLNQNLQQQQQQQSQQQNQKSQLISQKSGVLEDEEGQQNAENQAISNIEFLILRSNNLQGDIISKLCTTIKENNNCQIKHLELNDNQIGQEGIKAIGDLISSYQKLEYIGIGKNQIQDWDQLQPIAENIGYSQLDEEGLQKYREEEQEKENLLTLKAKKKKIDENRLQELEKMLPLKEIGKEGSGVFAYVRNPQLKILNLAMNPLNEKSQQKCESYIQNLPEDFSLILIHSNFKQEFKDRIRNRYKKNVVI
ncbi:hypothetical protein PPERSA_01627 [Pseudocohnilembus persalinus]|uniref:Uncharacterized protein n=1 Tax=Pseudocohnilembus persalinus TaxID=266149 RepID=A0A0V0QHR1_PSEPJ|nr:hypothetical protein PPERSA_01627 [Pseudocohnilembus persalinus]|eukprot:KRX01757.1 hypothetical protein PPERSA_01627 [Pseudocohnilembus persalinus]